MRFSTGGGLGFEARFSNRRLSDPPKACNFACVTGKKKLRIAYILSLPHSGSTILAHNLSKYHPVVNLGEAGYGMRRLATRAADQCPCACGKSARDCEFWGGLDFALMPTGETQDRLDYGRLSNRFRSVFGEDAILLDANKTSEPISYFCEMPDCEVFAIHLVRDFRGACVSEAIRKKKKHAGRATWFTATQAAFQWMRKNLGISRLLDSLPLAGRKCMSYEALCNNPQKTLLETGVWLGAAMEAGVAKDHALIGNTLEFSAGSREIIYDNRWKNSRSFYPALLLFPILPLLNRRWVYS